MAILGIGLEERITQTDRHLMCAHVHYVLRHILLENVLKKRFYLTRSFYTPMNFKLFTV